MAGQIIDLCLLSPAVNATAYQLFARQWLIDHKAHEQGDANAPEWRQLFAASAITVLRTAPLNLTADGRPDGVARPPSEHEPSAFERGMVARGYKQLVENGVAMWMCMDGGHSMLRPLEPATGGPLTTALNTAYASRLQLQPVQDREASGPGRVLPPRRSPLRPLSLRSSTLRSYRRAIECRDGVPRDQFARQWLLQHTPIGDAAQQVWTSLWGKLFTDEEADVPGSPSELELSLRAAWDQERQALRVAERLQRARESSEAEKYRLRELPLANEKRRRRLLKRGAGAKVGPPRGSCGKDRMHFLEERSREYARRRKARRMAERQTHRRRARR